MIILILDSTIDKLDKIHKKLAAHTIKTGKGLIIIFNKWDLIENKKNNKKELEKIVKAHCLNLMKKKFYLFQH